MKIRTCHTAGLIIALMLFFSVGIIANDNSFSIRSYIPEKFIDYQWSVDGGFNINGNNSRNTWDYNSNLDQWDHSDYSNDRQNLDFKSRFFYRNETIRRFFNISTEISLDASHNNSTSTQFNYDSPDTERDNFRKENISKYGFGIAPKINYGIYLYSDFFVDVNCDINAKFNITPESDINSYRGYKNNYNQPYLSYEEYITQGHIRDNQNNYNINSNVGAGWGRIYSGWYAATAMYIIEELENNGLLRKQPSKHEMLELTDMIYQNRNKKAIDNRLHKIKSLNDMISYLNTSGVIDYSDPYGYLLIQDVWDYFPRDSRNFGYKIRLALGMNYSYGTSDYSRYGYESKLITRTILDSNRVDTTLKQEYRNDIYKGRHDEIKYPYAELNFNYSRPINLRWQYDLSLLTRYYIDSYSLNKYSYSDFVIGSNYDTGNRTDYNDRLSMKIDGKVGYIFNSRTAGGAGVFYNYNSEKSNRVTVSRRFPVLNKQIINSNNRSNQFGLNGFLTYRISIPTTLRIKLGYNVSDSENENKGPRITNEDSHTGNYTLSMNISHYLF